MRCILELASMMLTDGLSTRKKTGDYITPIIAALNLWLPVCLRIDFMIVLLVFKALNGLAPAYICDLLTSYQ